MPYHFGLIISVICILGIIAIFLPNKCAKFFYQKKDSYKIDLESSTSQNLSYKIRGHHPSCEVFSAHILQIKDKIYCSGCLGLLVGGLIALPMGFFYFFFDLFIYINAFFIVLLGIVFVLFVYSILSLIDYFDFCLIQLLFWVLCLF